MLQLGKLNAIMMWGNNLTALPSNIGTMKRVVNLDVRHNQLRALPGTFESMTSLRYFQITGNPVCSDLNFELPKKLEDKEVCKVQCARIARGLASEWSLQTTTWGILLIS